MVVAEVVGGGGGGVVEYIYGGVGLLRFGGGLGHLRSGRSSTHTTDPNPHNSPLSNAPECTIAEQNVTRTVHYAMRPLSRISLCSECYDL